MPKNKSINPAIKYLTAVILGITVFITLNFIFALITVNTPYPKGNSLLYAVISIVLSSFISSFIYCFRQRQNGLVSGLIIGFIFTVIMFFVYTVFSSFKLGENSLLIIPAAIFPAAIAGILAVNLKRK